LVTKEKIENKRKKYVHVQYLIVRHYFRLFTRTLPIPFEKKVSKLSIKERIRSHSSLESLLVEVPKSISVIIKLHNDFKNMMTDALVDQIQTFMATNKLDVRSEINLAALLYSTGKVCMKIFSRYRYLYLAYLNGVPCFHIKYSTLIMCLTIFWFIDTRTYRSKRRFLGQSIDVCDQENAP
jgi:hypothetical protein